MTIIVNDDDENPITNIAGATVPREGEVFWLPLTCLNEDDTSGDEVPCVVERVEWQVSAPPFGNPYRTLEPRVFVRSDEEHIRDKDGNTRLARDETTPDPEKFAQMNAPYETPEDGTRAHHAFCADLAALRETHRIANVVVIASVRAKVEGPREIGDLIQLFTMGDSRTFLPLTFFACQRFEARAQGEHSQD